MADNEAEQLETDVEDINETPETDWQAEARKNNGVAKRYKTQNAKLKAELEEARKVQGALAKNEAPKTEKTGFDYAEKAYLKSSGIDSKDFAYLFEVSQTTGKDIDALLATKYVKAELKERAELRATEDATPEGTKRSGNAGVNTKEYWIAKIEAGTAKVTDIPDTNLQREVVQARRQRASQANQFSDNPIQ